MPHYEITASVAGVVCWLAEADSKEEAERDAREVWEMYVSDIQCCELESIEVEDDN